MGCCSECCLACQEEDHRSILKVELNHKVHHNQEGKNIHINQVLEVEGTLEFDYKLVELHYIIQLEVAVQSIIIRTTTT